jgi:hypothetical protein
MTKPEVEAMARKKDKVDLDELLMGPGWKVLKDDYKEKLWVNQNLGYVIQVRHQSWAQHRPVIVKWDGGEQDGFKFVPDAVEWIKERERTAVKDQAKKVAERFRAAAVALNEGTLKEIAELTDINNHTEALVFGAKAIKATKLVKRLELLLKLQDLEGHLPMALSQYRNGLADELMEAAKRALSPEDYEKFHGSY